MTEIGRFLPSGGLVASRGHGLTPRLERENRVRQVLREIDASIIRSSVCQGLVGWPWPSNQLPIGLTRAPLAGTIYPSGLRGDESWRGKISKLAFCGRLP
jgi:hypothetical protein